MKVMVLFWESTILVEHGMIFLQHVKNISASSLRTGSCLGENTINQEIFR